MAAAVVITLDQLPAEFGRVIASMGAIQFKPIGQVLAMQARRSNMETFKRGVSPDGTPFIPLAHQRPSGGSGLPLRDNGFLLASIQARATQNDLTVSSNLAYAGLHQFGGTIRPKKGKFLTIPATKEAKRYPARRFRTPLHAVVNRRGTAGVLLDDNDVVQYYLVKKVTVPARPFLGFSKNFIDYTAMLLGEVALRQIAFGQPRGAAQGPLPRPV